jgi:hypothetical protein
LTCAISISRSDAPRRLLDLCNLGSDLGQMGYDAGVLKVSSADMRLLDLCDLDSDLGQMDYGSVTCRGGSFSPRS